MGHRWRSVDQLISCQRGIHSRKSGSFFLDLLGFSRSDWPNLFLKVAADTLPSPFGFEQVCDFGPPASRCGD